MGNSHVLGRGSTALVTGASRGIGPLIAREIASEGGHVVLTARSVAELIKGAGQGQRTLDQAEMKAAAYLAPAQSVARAVVKAVQKDRTELVIMPGPARLMRAVMDYFPGLGPAMNRAAGTGATMQKIIELRDTASGVRG